MKITNYLMKIALVAVTLYGCSKNDSEIAINYGNEPQYTESLKPLPYQGGSSELNFESSSNWRLAYHTDTTDIEGTQNSNGTVASMWLNITPTSGGGGKTTITITADENNTLEERKASFSIKSGSLDKVFSIAQNPKIACLTVTNSRFKVPQEGGQINFNLITNVGINISIEQKSQPWISQAETNNLDSNHLCFNIAKSEDGNERNGTIELSGGGITRVIQIFQSFGKVLTIKQKQYNLLEKGGNITAEIESNFDFVVEMPNVDWITELTPGSTSNTRHFKISENDIKQVRSAEIIFKCEYEDISDTITITQEEQGYGYYESANYTSNGEVLTLQSVTPGKGKGINIVILGDGFSDKTMGTDGVYEQRMREAMDHFFSEEPFKSHREFYNVYTIKAVSKNEIYHSHSETIFGCKFGKGTRITGNDRKIFEYALKAVPTTKDLTIIVVLNSPIYAGTCYMYTNNGSISYCPIVNYDPEKYRQIIVHEAAGHGFGKLGDEYMYSGRITENAKSEYNRLKKMGWMANVDITSDRKLIRWAQLLSNDLYKGEINIIEGALTYQYGAYRSTNYSIMRENTGGFNAPSRETIYNRIMRLAGFYYQAEGFLIYDKINRTDKALSVRRAQAERVDRSNFIPLAPPVIIWSDPDATY